MIKVVAKIYAKEQSIQELILLYKELVEKSRQERGCIRYDFFQDIKEESHFVMIEEWESQQALEEHFQSAHFTEIVPKIKNFLAKATDVAVYKQVV